MKNTLALIVAGMIGSYLGTAHGQESLTDPTSVGVSAKKLAKVDAAMTDSVEQNRIAGGIVVITRHGKIVHFKSYGKRDLEADKPMQNDTIVRIYSMTKAITSAATMMLFDEGKLHYEDPVSKYIPELKNVKVAVGDKLVSAEREITVADLMLHTAGYSYGKSKQRLHNEAYADLNMIDPNITLEEFAKQLGDLPLAFQPGSDWQYGISIDVLGRVVEVASGQSLDEFFRARIFEPLNMPDTGFYVPVDKVERFAANYKSDGHGKLTLHEPPKTSRYTIKPRFFSGGGGLVSTAADYTRFLMMIANGGELDGERLLKSETVKRMTTNQLPKDVGWIKFGDKVRVGVGYGFGFNVRDEMSDWDPQGRVGEYGWGGAASTHYWVSPQDDLIVVTLEQIMPYSFMTETKLKGLIFDSIE